MTNAGVLIFPALFIDCGTLQTEAPLSGGEAFPVSTFWTRQGDYNFLTVNLLIFQVFHTFQTLIILPVKLLDVCLDFKNDFSHGSRTRIDIFQFRQGSLSGCSENWVNSDATPFSIRCLCHVVDCVRWTWYSTVGLQAQN